MNNRMIAMGHASRPSFSQNVISRVRDQNIESRERERMIAEEFANRPGLSLEEYMAKIKREISLGYDSDDIKIEADHKVENENKRQENVIYLDHSNEGFMQDYSQTSITTSQNTSLMQTVKEGADISVKQSYSNNWIDSEVVHEVKPVETGTSTSTSIVKTESVLQIVPQNIPSHSIIVRELSPLSDSSISSKPLYGSYYLLGRRTVLAYTLSSGYLLRSQGVRLDLGGQHNKKNTGSHLGMLSDSLFDKPGKTAAQLKKTANAAVYFNGLQKNVNTRKDRFSGGKIMFSTFFNESLGAISKQQKNVNGRLPNILCDFLVPLMTAGLIDIQGHVAYDVGSIGVFVDVPLSLHVMISPDFLSLSDENSLYNLSAAAAVGAGAGAGVWVGNKSSRCESQSARGADQVKVMLRRKAAEEARKELVAHANDLLLWFAYMLHSPVAIFILFLLSSFSSSYLSSLPLLLLILLSSIFYSSRTCNVVMCNVCYARLVDGEAAVLASKRSKEKEKEREKEREKEKEKEREKERLKDKERSNPLYSHLKGKESSRYKNEQQQPDTAHTAHTALCVLGDDDGDIDAAAAMKTSEEIEFAVDSVVVGDGETSAVIIIVSVIE